MALRKDLYHSAPNRDRWSLVREPASQRAFVEHESNASSGRLDVGRHILRSEALMHGGHGPEHQALLRLIGTLVEEPAGT
jgi:hypothetical protein